MKKKQKPFLSLNKKKEINEKIAYRVFLNYLQNNPMENLCLSIQKINHNEITLLTLTYPNCFVKCYIDDGFALFIRWMDSDGCVTYGKEEINQILEYSDIRKYQKSVTRFLQNLIQFAKYTPSKYKRLTRFVRKEDFGGII